MYDLGGRRQYKNGSYLLVHLPEHPNAYSNGCVYMHKAVMEQALGRLLTADEVVHHIDGNGLNNEVSNLQLLTKTAHTDLHSKVRSTRIPRTCAVCASVYTPDKPRSKYCSPSCSSLGQRKVQRPSIEQLQSEVSQLSYAAVGRLHGVSDNTVRKWLKTVG